MAEVFTDIPRKKYTGQIANTNTSGASIIQLEQLPVFQRWSIAYHSEVGSISHVKKSFLWEQIIWRSFKSIHYHLISKYQSPNSA